MKTYCYTIVTDIFDQPTSIEFETIEGHKEFVMQLLQILGMYNFMIIGHQNIWQEGEAFIKLSAPNGKITLGISSQKRIFLLANNNPKDLLKIDLILSRFSVFKKEEIQLTKSA